MDTTTELYEFLCAERSRRSVRGRLASSLRSAGRLADDIMVALSLLPARGSEGRDRGVADMSTIACTPAEAVVADAGRQNTPEARTASPEAVQAHQPVPETSDFRPSRPQTLPSCPAGATDRLADSLLAYLRHAATQPGSPSVSISARRWAHGMVVTGPNGSARPLGERATKGLLEVLSQRNPAPIYKKGNGGSPWLLREAK